MTLDLGNDGRRERALTEALPVEAVEPLVLLDVPDAALLVAEPLGGAVPAELLDELPRPARDVARKVDGVDALRCQTKLKYRKI